MNEILGYLKNIYIALALVVIVTFLVFINAIPNGFVIEDPIYISDWKLTQSLGNIPKMFMGDTAPTGNYGIYRPVRAVFYAISYALFGGGNPTIYHIQAVLVHLIIVALVFLIAEIIFKKRILSVIAALLFGLHPVHTEPVNYLTANFDTFSYIFFFASFYFYLRATSFLSSSNLIGGSINGSNVVDSRFRGNDIWKSRDYIISVVFATVAFFHFEMNLTLPLLIVLYDFCFRGHLFKRIKWENLFRLYGAFFISAGVFLFIRVVLLHMTVRGEYLGGSFYLTMLTMVKAVIKYLILLIFPVDLSVNPTIAEGITAWVHPLARMDKILSQTIFDKEIIFSLGIIGGIIAAAVKFYIADKPRLTPSEGSGYKQFRMIPFSIGFIFISILPVLYIIPQGPILQERYIYLASFGYVMLLTFGFNYFWEYKFDKDTKEYVNYGLIGILLVLLGFYGARTFTRNAEWKDNFTVWSTLAKQSPQDVIANFYTGNAYAQMNKFDEAIKYYNQALAIEPRLHEVHFGLGEIYSKTGNFDQAAVQYQQALTINPQFVQAKDKILSLNKADKDYVWEECKIGTSLVFSCPAAWEKTELSDGIRISDPSSNFIIEVTEGVWDTNKPQEDFVKSDTSTAGTLVNQGLANFLNAEVTYVKVFQVQNISDDPTSTSSANQASQKLQFFLFKGSKVVRVIVSPTSDPIKMSKFDRIASSIQFVEPTK